MISQALESISRTSSYTSWWPCGCPSYGSHTLIQKWGWIESLTLIIIFYIHLFTICSLNTVESFKISYGGHVCRVQNIFAQYWGWPWLRLASHCAVLCTRLRLRVATAVKNKHTKQVELDKTSSCDFSVCKTTKWHRLYIGKLQCITFYVISAESVNSPGNS